MMIYLPTILTLKIKLSEETGYISYKSVFTNTEYSTGRYESQN